MRAQPVLMWQGININKPKFVSFQVVVCDWVPALHPDHGLGSDLYL